jgi:hypothetical protein
VKYLDGEEYEEIQLIPTALYKKEDAEKDPELQEKSAAEENAAPQES